MSAALSYTPRAPLAGLLNEALDRGDLALAVKRRRDFRAGPANFYRPTDRQMAADRLKPPRQK